jgi:chaperonin cofactor prefoldin
MDQLKRENERLRALVHTLQEQNNKAIEELRTLRASFEAYIASTTTW